MRIGSSLPPLPDHRREYRGGPSTRADGEAERLSVPSRPAYRGTRELAALEASASVAPRNRLALQAYFANQPSVGERLGVELAGVDVYV